MSRTLILIPTAPNVGLISVALGMIRAMERQDIRISLFEPIKYDGSSDVLRDKAQALAKTNHIDLPQPITMSEVEQFLSSNRKSVLMEEIVAHHQKCINDNTDVVLIPGLYPTNPLADQLNYNIAQTLGAEIVLVTTIDGNSPQNFKERLEILKNNPAFEKRITGVIVNKVNLPTHRLGISQPEISTIYFAMNDQNEKMDQALIQEYSPFPVISSVPWNLDLSASRASDIAKHLNAEILHQGEMNERRIKHISFCSRSIPNMITHFRANALLVTSADRSDVIVAICLAVMNGTQIGAVLLTGDYDIEPSVQTLCQQAFDTGLPIFRVPTNTWETSIALQNMKLEVFPDDNERIEDIQNFFADHIDQKWIKSLSEVEHKVTRLSPPAFRYQLTELARRANKRIVLPEGNEPRTVKAAILCAEQNIAQCVLLGNPEEIHRVATSQGLELPSNVEIIDPVDIREKYVPRLVELRKNKGMTDEGAREQLIDNVVLGTLMLEQDHVDGLVSGAVHTTANTIRPALQLIKTAPGSSLVSSVFFMLMPEQVYIYGDCAINPDPNASELADIAIQSADTAISFGIEAKVAMISYSTGNSGAGADVDKVREATKLAQERRPDLLIDGPLQYDAAVMPDVAKSKAPNSQVAGQATVFVFPDLNTGNTTYKAVQRSADLVSIGPMLQGMRKPVNDLSRGALVDDIVYTIALTAIQATQTQQ